MEVHDLISETHLSQAISQMNTALKIKQIPYFINPQDTATERNTHKETSHS